MTGTLGMGFARKVEVANALKVELQVLLKGIEICSSLNLHHVIIEGNYLTIVNCL